MVVYSDPATYYLLPTTYYVPPTTYYLLLLLLLLLLLPPPLPTVQPTTYYVLPTTYDLLPTTYYYCCYYCYYYYHHHYLQWGGRGGVPTVGGGRGERVTRAYTVEVQTASVFCSRRVLCLYISTGTKFMSTPAYCVCRILFLPQG